MRGGIFCVPVLYPAGGTVPGREDTFEISVLPSVRYFVLFLDVGPHCFIIVRGDIFAYPYSTPHGYCTWRGVTLVIPSVHPFLFWGVHGTSLATYLPTLRFSLIVEFVLFDFFSLILI